jgi:hypothetical protein
MTSPLNSKRKSTQRWDERAGCAGKVRFETHDMAQQVASSRARGPHNIRRGCYRCPQCHGFHIGRRNELGKNKQTERRRNLEELRQAEAEQDEKDEARVLQQQHTGL